MSDFFDAMDFGDHLMGGGELDPGHGDVLAATGDDAHPDGDPFGGHHGDLGDGYALDPWTPDLDAAPGVYVDTWEPGTLTCQAGDVGEMADHRHYQGAESACAVVSQGTIIESVTGAEFDQAATTDWLEAQGWYDPAAGTDLEDLTRLLDAHGLDHHDGPLGVTDLYDCLARGDKVMVTLDANEIWTPAQDPLTGLPLEQPYEAGHAVVVTGMGFDTVDHEWKVVINDSGHPDGRANEIPLGDFVNAFADYGNYSVVIPADQLPDA